MRLSSFNPRIFPFVFVENSTGKAIEGESSTGAVFLGQRIDGDDAFPRWYRS